MTISPVFEGHPDPYPDLAQLRAEGAVQFSEPSQVWFVFSYAAAHDLLRHPQALSRQAYLRGLEEQHGTNPILKAQKQELAFQDPPQHSQLKRLVMHVFSPARLKSFEPHVRQLAEEAVAALPKGEVFDLLEAFADPLPGTILSELLGVPPADRPPLVAATEALVMARGVVRTPERLAAGSRGVEQLSSFFERLCELRKDLPGQDLLTDLMAAPDLSHSQLLSVVTSMYAASYGNVRNLVGNGLLALLRRPEQLRRLRNDLSLLPTAVEEMLRFDPPTQATNPAALTAETVVGGVALPLGSRVALHLGSCNRDPEHFSEPDEFVLDRHPNDHLAFSSGTHFCAGAALVRLEATTMLRALLERCEPSLAGDVSWHKTDRFRGLDTLPVRLTLS